MSTQTALSLPAKERIKMQVCSPLVLVCTA